MRTGGDALQLAGSVRSSLLFLLRVIFLFVVCAVVLAGGSARELPLHLFAVAIFSIAAAAALFWNGERRLPLPVVVAIGVAGTAALWALVQAWQFEGNPLANPIWQEASAIAGPMAGAISVAPADTLQAIVPITLPFAVFIAGFLLFDDDRKAMQLLVVLLALAAIGSVIGIVQNLYFPKMLLLWEKKHYIGSVTVYFINRNTTATYCGTFLVLAAGFVVHYLQSFGRDGRLKISLGTADEALQADAYRLAASAVALIVILLALALTKSRAGLVASLAGVLVFSAIISYYGLFWKSGKTKVYRSSLNRTAAIRVALFTLPLLALFAILGARTFQRANVLGFDDERFCVLPGIVRLAEDNWLTGTGFGTFTDVFPAYRPPDCGITEIWTKAHNFYLEGWQSGGILFFALLAIVLAVVWIAYRSGLKSRKLYRWVPAVGIGATVVTLAHCAVDFSLQIPGFAVVYAALMAGCMQIAYGRRYSRYTGSGDGSRL